jgi:hypothetical protein
VTETFTAAGIAQLEDIVDHAVVQEQAPGVVAVVASGDSTHTVVAGEATIGGPRCAPTRCSASRRSPSR